MLALNNTLYQLVIGYVVAFDFLQMGSYRQITNHQITISTIIYPKIVFVPNKGNSVVNFAYFHPLRTYTVAVGHYCHVNRVVFLV